jgi:hypothetical protein
VLTRPTDGAKAIAPSNKVLHLTAVGGQNVGFFHRLYEFFVQ